jgi:hypothetical protein
MCQNGQLHDELPRLETPLGLAFTPHRQNQMLTFCLRQPVGVALRIDELTEIKGDEGENLFHSQL